VRGIDGEAPIPMGLKCMEFGLEDMLIVFFCVEVDVTTTRIKLSLLVLLLLCNCESSCHLLFPTCKLLHLLFPTLIVFISHASNLLISCT
jgi:hypothetical protein